MKCPYCGEEMRWSSAGYEYCPFNQRQKYPTKHKHLDQFNDIKIEDNKEFTIISLEELIKQNNTIIEEYNKDIAILERLSKQCETTLQKLRKKIVIIPSSDKEVK